MAALQTEVLQLRYSLLIAVRIPAVRIKGTILLKGVSPDLEIALHRIPQKRGGLIDIILNIFVAQPGFPQVVIAVDDLFDKVLILGQHEIPYGLLQLKVMR